MTSFQYEFWQVEFPKPTREQVQACMPAGYERVYGSNMVREIFDATELFIETPSCIDAQRACYSNYKNHTTAKIIGAITPGGAAVFSSDAYPGKVTDPMLTKACGYIDRAEKGDLMSADRGFEGCKHDFNKLGVDLVAPPTRFRNQGQFTEDEARETFKQANLRIHIERAYARAKAYKMLGQELPLDGLDLIGKIFNIVFLVCNNPHASLINSI